MRHGIALEMASPSLLRCYIHVACSKPTWEGVGGHTTSVGPSPPGLPWSHVHKRPSSPHVARVALQGIAPLSGNLHVTHPLPTCYPAASINESSTNTRRAIKQLTIPH